MMGSVDLMERCGLLCGFDVTGKFAPPHCILAEVYLTKVKTQGLQGPATAALSTCLIDICSSLNSLQNFVYFQNAI
jgi:hypothetical protein